MERHSSTTLATALLFAFSSCVLAAPAPQRQAQLQHLLEQDCGACHGLYLTGGLGPPLTQQALAGKSRDSLIATVTLGRPGSAMPGWAALLDPNDIRWLVDRLLQGKPAS
ncbi:cytochrome c [Pseudomonas sp. G2-4]|uniref:c-type cytochrome n=1 Tax=Pseudomonas sp. G2-4 TaxID=1506334 RepID=UPI0024B9E42D|nr:cytochrome c [Pseudomonas sp. G2-4]WHS57885.1 cytochrome c [Pseudomonas sp. G2-4]